MGKNGWKWYFAILAVLTLLAMGIMIAYNLRQQLKPEQIETAQKLWEKKGPRNYLLNYTVRKNDETSVDHYVVKVKDSKAYEVLLNGRPIEKLRFTMDQLFEDIDQFMEIDQKKGNPRTFVRALFDPETGAIRYYVRRVMGTSNRLEIEVKPLEVRS